ncbi:MAG: metallophosphoesterase family protein [Candidatus Nanoarchaeia archaeon]
MKILAIGDTHGSEKIKKIPIKDIDLILLTGDLGKADLMRKYAFAHLNDKKPWVHLEPKKIVKEAFLEAYNSSIGILSYLSKKAPVYFVYGNVEASDSETLKLSRKLKINLPLFESKINKMKNVYAINNKKIQLEDLTLAGGEYFVDECWVKSFTPNDKKRMKRALKETRVANKFYSRLGQVDILLCHQPPYGFMDKVTNPNAPKAWIGKHAGSEVILNYIKNKHPKYVLCGHIHEAKGETKIGKTKLINLGCCGDYKILEI